LVRSDGLPVAGTGAVTVPDVNGAGRPFFVVLAHPAVITPSMTRAQRSADPVRCLMESTYVQR
jgi:hypothetical protein